MKISLRACIEGCVRQTAYAGMCLVGLSILAEWIMPGSVLPFVHIYWFAVGVCALLSVSTSATVGRLNRVAAVCCSAIVACGVYVLLADGRSVLPFTIASFFVTLALFL